MQNTNKNTTIYDPSPERAYKCASNKKMNPRAIDTRHSSDMLLAPTTKARVPRTWRKGIYLKRKNMGEKKILLF